jgi:Zn-dependent protease with chaperone function
MNFFEHQDRARKATGRLVVLFALAVVATIAAVFGAVVVSFDLTSRAEEQPTLELFGIVSASTAAVIGLGSLYKIVQLRAGGAAVAGLLGGTPVLPGTTAADERTLMNVVEEMAIASGTPVPAVYVLREETGINALAAGWTPGDAAICVTRGALEHLSRDELQGVIAHEFSHILNGDMRLNIRLMGIVHGILVIGLAGYAIVRTALATGGSRRRGRGKGGGPPLPLIAFGAALIAVGYIGVFFGRLIKAAVARQREVLADASAVQFTRNPRGLSGALQKIGGMVYGARLASPKAPEASHFFFADALAPPLVFARLFATHPPLEERIRLIDPSWDGTFPAVRLGEVRPEYERKPAKRVSPAEIKAAQAAAVAAGLAPERVVGRAGAPTPAHVSYGAGLIASLPDAVREAAREPYGAQALVCALLLHADPEVRRRQLGRLPPSAAPGLAREVSALAAEVDRLGNQARLPLIELALPALRHLSRPQGETFATIVEALTAGIPELGILAFALRKVALRNLARAQGRATTAARQRYFSVAPLEARCRCVLSALARAGQDAEVAARAAYLEAMRRLFPERTPDLMPAGECTLEAIDAALDEIALAAPGVKARILDACARCVAHDGLVRPLEAELLRAFAAALDCPIPPVVGEEEALPHPAPRA